MMRVSEQGQMNSCKFIHLPNPGRCGERSRAWRMARQKKETLVCDWMCQEKWFQPPRKKKEISVSGIYADFFFFFLTFLRVSGEKGIGRRAPSSALLVHSGEVVGGVSNLAPATRPGPKSCSDRFGWSWTCRHIGFLIPKKKDRCWMR